MTRSKSAPYTHLKQSRASSSNHHTFVFTCVCILQVVQQEDTSSLVTMGRPMFRNGGHFFGSASPSIRQENVKFAP
uniref:Secreted protein n=1 Tax=Steinernema glaseri TaxID=37863 RepID=A0A1I7ZFN2_9BILA